MPKPGHVARQLMQMSGNGSVDDGKQNQGQADDFGQVSQHQCFQRARDLGIDLGVRLRKSKRTNDRLVVRRHDLQAPQAIDRAIETRQTHIAHRSVQREHFGSDYHAGCHDAGE